jgi:CO/xanthine dehydrogenase FAD-binding subunit
MALNLHRPTSLQAALEILSNEATARPTPIAGGTDLLVHWPGRDTRAVNFLDLSLLKSELGGIHLGEDSLEMGALATYWELITHKAAATEFPLLAEAARQVGAVQIQTRGTWAGNIGNGSPAADGVPVLLAYDAELTLASVRGLRSVALCDYWTGYKQTVKQPDELIVGIRLPRRAREVQFWHKVGARSAQAITKVGVAAVKNVLTANPDEASGAWRVVANSVAPFVKRCRTLEQALDAGKQPTSPEAVLALLTPDIQPIDDIRSTAEYRAQVLARIIYFGLQEHAPALV